MPKAVQGPPGFIFLSNDLSGDVCRARAFRAPTTDHQRVADPLAVAPAASPPMILTPLQVQGGQTLAGDRSHHSQVSRAEQSP